MGGEQEKAGGEGRDGVKGRRSALVNVRLFSAVRRAVMGLADLTCPVERLYGAQRCCGRRDRTVCRISALLRKGVDQRGVKARVLSIPPNGVEIGGGSVGSREHHLDGSDSCPCGAIVHKSRKCQHKEFRHSTEQAPGTTRTISAFHKAQKFIPSSAASAANTSLQRRNTANHPPHPT